MSDTLHINWYPGHMAKARRALEEAIRQVDVVIQLLDARAPMASMNPDLNRLAQNKRRVYILNKADLADPAVTKAWIARLSADGSLCCSLDARKGVKRVSDLVRQAAAELIRRYQEKGVRKTVRAMVVGVPNVGKSTLINSLSGGSRAKTGDKPGVTRGTQWIRLGSYLDLLDTPGLLWPHLEEQRLARHLAYTGAINDDVLDSEELVLAFIEELHERYPQALAARYGIDESVTGREALDAICARRGWRIGGAWDYQRAARVILDEFRAGKCGAISLERPEEEP